MNTKLQNARKRIGFTQVEIARKAKISVMAYQRYEYGERVPNATIAILIAKALNSTVEKLF